MAHDNYFILVQHYMAPVSIFKHIEELQHIKRSQPYPTNDDNDAF